MSWIWLAESNAVKNKHSEKKKGNIKKFALILVALIKFCKR